MVSKVFEKLEIIGLFVENCDLFSYIQYGFKSSQSTEDLPAVVSDRVDRCF